MSNEKSEQIINIAFIIVMVFSICMLIISIFSPELAFADGSGSGSGGSNSDETNIIQLPAAIDALKGIITTLFLPVSIILCAWRIVYIAVVCGIMGMDPLNMVYDGDDNGMSAQEIKIAFLANLTSFVKGLCWIGGIWIIFQLCLSIAGMLAGQFANAFK